MLNYYYCLLAVKLTLFYLSFYAGLAALFAACWFGFMSSVHEDRPVWSLENDENKTPYIHTPGEYHACLTSKVIIAVFEIAACPAAVIF